MSRLDAEVSLEALVASLRSFPGTLGKSSISLVSDVFGPSDWVAGPGDDGAVVPLSAEQPDVGIVSCGEAIHPSFVAQDPYGAGIAAVLANVNDLAAMGATPLAIVDTVVASGPVARLILEGMRDACRMYDVPLVGGHLTEHDGPPALSAFAVGRCGATLSVSRSAPGQTLMLAAALDGEMRTDFPFFRAFEARGRRMADDIRVLPALAESGDAVAAKDVSMAGLVGTLGMLLECHRLGARVDLAAIPRPDGVPVERWLACFPSYAFLLCVPAGREDAVRDRFEAADLTTGVIGSIDGSGLLQIGQDGRWATVFDFSHESVTGLR